MTRYGYWSAVGGRSAATWGETSGYAAAGARRLQGSLGARNLDPTVYVARRDHSRDTVVHVVCLEDTFDDLSNILQEQ